MVEVAAETRAHALRQAVNGVGDYRERRDRHPRGGEVPAGPTTVPQWQRAEKACVVSVSITDVPCEASPAVESMALPEGSNFDPTTAIEGGEEFILTRRCRRESPNANSDVKHNPLSETRESLFGDCRSVRLK